MHWNEGTSITVPLKRKAHTNMHKEAWCGMWVKYSRALYVSSGRVHNCQCVTSLGLLCYIVSLLKDMSTHTFAHKHRRTSNAWHINEGMETDMWCSVIYTHIHRHTKGPEDGWGWWQCLFLCQCQSLQRNEAECPAVTHSLSSQSDINDPLSLPARPS